MPSVVRNAVRLSAPQDGQGTSLGFPTPSFPPSPGCLPQLSVRTVFSIHCLSNRARPSDPSRIQCPSFVRSRFIRSLPDVPKTCSIVSERTVYVLSVSPSPGTGPTFADSVPLSGRHISVRFPARTIHTATLYTTSRELTTSWMTHLRHPCYISENFFHFPAEYLCRNKLSEPSQTHYMNH